MICITSALKYDSFQYNRVTQQFSFQSLFYRYYTKMFLGICTANEKQRNGNKDQWSSDSKFLVKLECGGPPTLMLVDCVGSPEEI